VTCQDPHWLTDKAAEEGWQPAQWKRWRQLRRRFESLRAEPRYTAAGGGAVSVAGLDVDDQLAAIARPLRADDQFPLLAALVQVMSETAETRWRQVADSLTSTRSRSEPDLDQERLRPRAG
jgi:hypothetical protein